MLPQKKTWLVRGHVLVPARQALPAGDYQIDHEIKVTYGQIQSINDTYGQIYDREREMILIELLRQHLSTRSPDRRSRSPRSRSRSASRDRRVRFPNRALLSVERSYRLVNMNPAGGEVVDSGHK